MDQITKPPISKLPSLAVLKENYLEWGREVANKTKKFSFERQKGLYKEIRFQLAILTNNHCSFCDGFPVGTESTEQIEHYFPKDSFPLLAYDWDNLFYCCNVCNTEANKGAFQDTLKPDHVHYRFETCFYFDAFDGGLCVMEDLERKNKILSDKAKLFLLRYGINNPQRKEARLSLIQTIKDHFIAIQVNNRESSRNEFKYRYVYDFCLKTSTFRR